APPTPSALAKAAPIPKESAPALAEAPPPTRDVAGGIPATKSDSNGFKVPAPTQGAKKLERTERERFAATGVAALVPDAVAEVIAVRARGAPGAYEFDVTVKSADAGCARYADWWEVVNEDGRLLYRR